MRQHFAAPDIPESVVTTEIELINDGDGLAVLGAPEDVEAFLTSYGLESSDLNLKHLGPQFKVGAGILNAASGAAANSGRWMKLTQESAAATKHLPLVMNSTTGNLHATLRATNGQFAKNLQFMGKPTSMLTNPALLTGAAGIMAQMAMQQAMDEISDYLAVIDAKVDDVLRAQKDSVLSAMIGVDLVIEEAMTIRREVGRVSDVTWSKVQGTALTIATTQAYALRQIDALVEKVDTASVGEIAATAKTAEPKVREWLSVIARCVQLQDALAVLELDRVLDGSPEDLQQHRMGVKAARQNRLTTIHNSTELLLERLNIAGQRANAKMLLAPLPARAAVTTSNRVVEGVLEFQTVLGIEDGHESTEAKLWRTAAGEAKSKILETGADGADAAKQFSGDTLARAKSGAGRLSSGVRAFRRAVRHEDSDPSQD